MTTLTGITSALLAALVTCALGCGDDSSVAGSGGATSSSDASTAGSGSTASSGSPASSSLSSSGAAGTGGDAGNGGGPGAGGAPGTGGGGGSGPGGAGAGGAESEVVYTNDFETDTDGFDIIGTSVLPTDEVGGESTYLGQRSPITTSAVLTVEGLTAGETYGLAFDLYIGGTWDGSLGFGPDFFTLTSSSAGTLMNATFRNGFPIGDATPGQSYSDASPIGDDTLFRTREGADVELAEPIYYIGHGEGNPTLTFVAASGTETLTFTSVDAQGITDEFFALDNVVVTSSP